MSARSRTLLVAAVLVGALAGSGLALAVVGPAASGPVDDQGTGQPSDGDVASVSQFGNASAFQAYVERGQARSGAGYFQGGAGTVGDGSVRFQGSEQSAGGDGGASAPRAEPDSADAVDRPRATQTPAQAEAMETVAEDDAAAGDGAAGGSGERVGETNIQVAGLDEPDMVKTDGSHFYYAPERHGQPRPVPEPRSGLDVDRRPTPDPDTHVIDVDDPAAPEEIADIDDAGRLLRTGDRLVVLRGDRLVAYDVSDPADPTEAWSRPLEDPIVTARERNGTVYLVTRSRVNPGSLCPIEPLGDDVSIPCGDIYRPDAQIDVDATYSAFAIDAAGGDVHDSVSFVGTGHQSAVYMSHEALYVTYTTRTDRSDLFGTFLTDSFDRTPDRVERRITELRSYDISPASRQREVQQAVQRWTRSLNESERDDVREALSEEFASFVADRQRDLERTGVVRVAVEDTALSVAATGEVPGEPLNQFSLSEHEGTLRVATTVPGAGDAESQNDLYALNADSLDEIGRVTGMGEGQRVYAVRYVDDTAYVVTFRRVDPLHVVDLSDPADPVERGTLELPGFSSYLHPIDDDHVLGIGEEDGKVKTVLFDVSDPTDPTIADDHVYDERWSAVADSHHAFTIDRRHGVFFLPAGDAGHLVDYTNGTLSIEHTVETDAPAQRARYVGDYLYVFAGDEVAVVDQTTWERETTLELGAGE